MAGMEAALAIEIDDLEVAAANDAPIDTGALRANTETSVEGFHGGTRAQATLRFLQPYSAAQEVGRIVYKTRVVRQVRFYTRVDPNLGKLNVRKDFSGHLNPIGPIEINLTPRHGGKSRYVESNLKARIVPFAEFTALAARRAVEAG